MYSIKGYGIDMKDSDIAYDENEGVVIYSDVYPTESAKAVNPKLTLKVNTAGTLDLTLPPGNAGYKRLRKMVSEIVVYRDNVERWSGRIIGQKFDFNNNEILTCEGELAYLNDTVQSPGSLAYLNNVKEFSGSYEMTIHDFLDTVLKEHNRQIDQSLEKLDDLLSKASSDEERADIRNVIAFEKKKKFSIGAVATDDTEKYEFVTDDKDTLTTIMENLVDKFGGYLIVRKDQNERKLDYKKGAYAQAANPQQIRFGLNLLDYTKNWDLNDLVTVIIPRGASLDDFTTSELVEYYNKPYTEKGREEYLKAHPEAKGEYKCRTLGSTVEGEDIPEDMTGVKARNDNGIESYYANSWGGFWRDYWNERKTGEDGKSYGAYLDLCFDQSGWTLENCDIKPTPQPGDRYFASLEAIKQFGWICAVVDFEDVKEVSVLRQKAEEYMKDKQFGEMIIEVTSLDLRYLGVVDEADAIRLLDKVRCISAPHGLDKEMIVTELTIDFSRPDNSTYTMTTEATASESGGTVSTFTETTIVREEESKKENSNLLQNAFNSATNYINSATRGHVTITRDANGTEALHIIDNSTVNGDPLWNFNPETGYWGDDDVFKNPDGIGWKDSKLLKDSEKIELWKWNLNGLGWSVNGGRSFEGVAITSNGEIDAERITTGELTAITIQGGYDEQTDKYNSSWNLSTGEFTMTRGSITIGQPDSAGFSVDSSGKLKSTLGEIGGFTISNNNLSNRTLDLHENGLSIRNYENYSVIGTFSRDYWSNDKTKCGMTIDLERDGSYIAFGYANPDNMATEFQYKLFYIAPNAGLHDDTGKEWGSNKWYFGCPLNMNAYTFENARISDCHIDAGSVSIFDENPGYKDPIDPKTLYSECWFEFIIGVDFVKQTVSKIRVTFTNGFVTAIGPPGG